MKKPMECDWCGGVVGKAYQNLKDSHLKITSREKEEIQKRKKEPINYYDIQMLMGLGLGYFVYEAGGHPWMKNGCVVSHSSIYKLYGLGFTKMEAQQFKNEKMGRRWKLTKKGEDEVKKIILLMCDGNEG